MKIHEYQAKQLFKAQGIAVCPGELAVTVDQVRSIAETMEGRCAVKMDDTGETTVMTPGDLVFVPPGHESWVVGEERYVSLHFLGTEGYAKG